jgi:dTDP-4-amino-4,6-dideoxygalactose transaminase
LQAAIGLHQVGRVDAYWEKRRHVWEKYNAAFAGLPASVPAPLEPHARHALHLYTLLIDEKKSPVTRDQLLTELHLRQIGSGVHYRPIPVHPAYQDRFGWKPEDFPNAEAIGRATISLPLSAKLTDTDIDDVINAVREVLTNGN